MSKKRHDVERQKGPIEPNMPTLKHMPYSQKQAEQAAENMLIRKHQSLDYVEPKR